MEDNLLILPIGWTRTRKRLKTVNKSNNQKRCRQIIGTPEDIFTNTKERLGVKKQKKSVKTRIQSRVLKAYKEKTHKSTHKSVELITLYFFSSIGFSLFPSR